MSDDPISQRPSPWGLSMSQGKMTDTCPPHYCALANRQHERQASLVVTCTLENLAIAVVKSALPR
jgi:hypothetical protein